MVVACYHLLPLPACMLHFDLVSIPFGTSIPTSFNILVKTFLHLLQVLTSYYCCLFLLDHLGLGMLTSKLNTSLTGQLELLYTYCIAAVLASVLHESQVLTTYAMIPRHMLTFRSMVAEFCSLVILIHNTLLGEVTISST